MLNMPSQGLVQEVITERVAEWLTEETRKLWGENFLKENETIEDKLQKEGYEVIYQAKGFNTIYTLMKGQETVSTVNLNLMDIIKGIIKKDTL